MNIRTHIHMYVHILNIYMNNETYALYMHLYTGNYTHVSSLLICIGCVWLLVVWCRVHLRMYFGVLGIIYDQPAMCSLELRSELSTPVSIGSVPAPSANFIC